MERCPLCPGVNNCVPADGPPSNIMLIGEAPGKDEQRRLVPFVGKTGQELNDHYLPLAGLRRDSVTVTNAIKCLPASHDGKLKLDREKDVQLLESCAQCHLYPEISRCNPTLIVPMGAFACRAVSKDINLELQHGIPVQTEWGTAFPMYHPALGIHSPKRMLLLRNDWIRLRKYIKGILPLPTDKYPDPIYKEVMTPDDVGTDLVYGEENPLACDTESTRDREPFCLTYSNEPGRASLIRANDLESLELFQHFLDRWEGPIIWHNWLYDYGVVTKMGLKFPHRLIKDTMQLAYHLGNLPQGLKALAYRELGMEMSDFDDLVTPFSRQLVLDYYYKAYYRDDWEKPPEQLVKDKDGKWKMYKPHSMKSKLGTFFTYWKKNNDMDVFKAWDNWEEDHQLIQDKCGRWPGKCITHAWEKDKEAVIRYACRDADATLRLYPILQHMRSRVRKAPQESWGN